MIGVYLMETKAAVVIPNWNGMDSIADCLKSLQAQSLKARIIVVENGSTDGSVEFLRDKFSDIDLLIQPKNLGFAGGVNVGIRHAIELGMDYVALFNNDAIADKDWLKHLVAALSADPPAGMAACKLLSADKSHLDSTGDYYTTWGLPYPRGRREEELGAYDDDREIFGVSGGASLYRTAMFNDIGFFDEDFFAYYEDVDLSFRGQLAGWRAIYVPEAEAYHQQGATSSKIKGFATYQTFKNYPWLFWKNVPLKLVPIMLPRFALAHLSIAVSSLTNGRGWPAFKGFIASVWLFPKKLAERHRIQKNRRVSVDYIRTMLVNDLPPNAIKLRRLRALFTGRR